MTRLLSLLAFSLAVLLTLLGVIVPAWQLRAPHAAFLLPAFLCLLAWAVLSLRGRWRDPEALALCACVLASVGPLLWAAARVGG